MFNFNRPKQFLLFLIVLLASGCSNQSPKTIYSTDADHHTSYYKNLRHKKPVLLKPSKKQSFNERDLIWDRLLSLYALPEVDDPRVERELNWFLDHPDYIARVQQRAEPYLYQIVNEIEAQHVPGEMALLPIVESAFKPDAVSSASAAGLWQFMPATGKDFGLKQNWWYDGRHDIYTSTQAAATYLKDLSENFDGDWLLALASYNYGKGNIQKAIDRNALMGEPTDYWSLRSLPEETMHYVPKLLAIAKLFAHADEYNIPLHPIRNKPVFEVVDVGSPLYLTQAAAMANTSPEHFLKLNPAFKQNATAPDGPHHLLIPVAQVNAFKENLGRIPDQEKEHLTYQIRNQYLEMLALKRAEELERIARKAEAERALHRAQELRLAQIKAAQLEKRAQKERVSRKKAAEILLAKNHKKQLKAHSEVLYVANKSSPYQKVAYVIADNSNDSTGKSNVSSKNGQKLANKNAKSNSNKKPIQTIHYVVKKGESLTGVARKFNVSVADIRKWNADKMLASLQVGQKIKVIIDANHPVT